MWGRADRDFYYGCKPAYVDSTKSKDDLVALMNELIGAGWMQKLDLSGISVDQSSWLGVVGVLRWSRQNWKKQK